MGWDGEKTELALRWILSLMSRALINLVCELPHQTESRRRRARHETRRQKN